MTPQGRQSVKKLMNHGVNTSRIPLDGSTRLFDRIARKYNVDYAFRKVGPKQYRLFFKAGQADAITDCFAEYTKRMMKKERQPSVRKQLGRANEAAARQRPREQEHKREIIHDR
ncbi:MAG: PcfB family protein [[Clostridium] leptum]